MPLPIATARLQTGAKRRNRSVPSGKARGTRVLIGLASTTGHQPGSPDSQCVGWGLNSTGSPSTSHQQRPLRRAQLGRAARSAAPTHSPGSACGALPARCSRTSRPGRRGWPRGPPVSWRSWRRTTVWRWEGGRRATAVATPPCHARALLRRRVSECRDPDTTCMTPIGNRWTPNRGSSKAAVAGTRTMRSGRRRRDSHAHGRLRGRPSSPI